MQSQIPAIVKDFLNSDKQGGVQGSLADADFEALAQAHVNIIAGTCLSIGKLGLFFEINSRVYTFYLLHDSEIQICSNLRYV